MKYTALVCNYQPIDSPDRLRIRKWCDHTFGAMWGDTVVEIIETRDYTGEVVHAGLKLKYMFWNQDHATMFKLAYHDELCGIEST